MGWTITDGIACYSGAAGSSLVFADFLTIGETYFVQITMTDRTQGKIVFPCFDGSPEYNIDGDHTFFGVANTTSLIITGEDDGGAFDGCIEAIQLNRIPLYSIKDKDGNTVFTLTDTSQVTVSGTSVQYPINWSDISEGEYYIEFEDIVITYQSDCINLKESHPCTIKLTWNNDENAYGFNYVDLDFTPTLRLVALLGQESFSEDKNDIFIDSAGNRKILYARTFESQIMTIAEAPKYIHKAIAFARKHDNLYIDGIKYNVDEEKYTPKWRKSSLLAPSEIIVIKSNQNYVNDNCG